MSIKRYNLFTTIDSGQVINLSDVIESQVNQVYKSTTHDLYTSSAVGINVKINDAFRTFEASADGFNRIEFAYLQDIQLVGSVNGTVVEMIGSDQKSDT
jgi:hypothetical protein